MKNMSGMSEKLSGNDKEFYKKIDEVIHYLWDPISISSCPNARNEYYSYLPKIFYLAKKDNNANEIAKYLNEVQSKKIGVEANINKCKFIASIIVSWGEYINDDE